MEPKKSKKADLQNKRTLFIEIGLFVSIGLMILAFNWSQSENVVAVIDTQIIAAEQDVVEITREPPKNSEPRANIQMQSDVLNLVKNDVKILVDPTFVDLDEDRPLIIPNGTNGEGSDGGGGDDIFFFAEENAKFQGGGLDKFHAWVSSNISNNYPAEAKARGITGKVMVKFIIEKDGSLTGIEVIQSPNKILSDAVIKVLKASPKWTPGRQGRRPVRTAYNIPVEFTLN